MWSKVMLSIWHSCPLPNFALKWGRETVDDCSDDESKFPEPTMDGEEMFDYFKSSFGFDKNQVRTLTSKEAYLLSN
jgi:hypothetical protein